MTARLQRALPAVLGLLLFAVALFVLRRELHAVTWHELTSDVLATPAIQILAALLLTALNYGALTGYDLLAFAYIGNPLSRWRVAGASFLAYAVANSVGFAMFSGAAVRYRFYTRWGVTAQELSRIVFSYSVTFWLGLLALGGLSLVASPLPGAHELPAHELVAPVGWLLLLTSVAYLVAVVVRREPIRAWKFELPLPPPRIGFAQLGVSALGLGARRRGALRPAAAEQPVVPGPAGGLPGGAAPRARQPRAGRRGRLRGLDGASAQALPVVRAASARAGRLPPGLLPAAAGRRARGAGRRRAAPAPRAGRARGRLPGLAQRRDRAAGPGRLHVPGRGGPALLGRHSGGAGPPRLARRPPAARCDRGLALPRQHRRRRPAAGVAGALATARRRVLPGRGRDRARASRRRSSRARTSRKRRCWPCCCSCCGARDPPSIAGRRSSTRASRPAGSWPSWGRWAPRSGWACSPSSTSSTPTSCGGSSSSGRRRRASCERRSERPWRWSSFGFGTADAPRPPRDHRAHGRRSRGRRRRDRRAGRHVPLPGLPAGQGAALRRGPQGLRDVRRPGRGRGSRSAIPSDRPTGWRGSFDCSSSAATTSAASRSSTRSARRACTATPTSA